MMTQRRNIRAWERGIRMIYILHREPYDTCPDCGAHLDPGEHCDCDKDTDKPRQTEDFQ